MTIQHHPEPDTLISYAAGTLPGAISCVVACHLSMCKICAQEMHWLETLGGLILEKDQTGTTPTSKAFTHPAAHWFADMPPPANPQQSPPITVGDAWLPTPLALYLGMRGDDIPWKQIVRGVRQLWVKLPKHSGPVRLLRLAPGVRLLEHAHRGMELTLVLQGVYADHTGEYVRGDVIEWAEDTLHQPWVSGADECICLVGSEKMPRFSRLTARLLRPFMGF